MNAVDVSAVLGMLERIARALEARVPGVASAELNARQRPAPVLAAPVPVPPSQVVPQPVAAPKRTPCPADGWSEARLARMRSAAVVHTLPSLARALNDMPGSYLSMKRVEQRLRAEGLALLSDPPFAAPRAAVVTAAAATPARDADAAAGSVPAIGAIGRDLASAPAVLANPAIPPVPALRGPAPGAPMRSAAEVMVEALKAEARPCPGDPVPASYASVLRWAGERGLGSERDGFDLVRVNRKRVELGLPPFELAVKQGRVRT